MALYHRYANLRGWHWGAAKLGVVLLLLALGRGHALYSNLVVTVALVDAYVKRPVRDGCRLADVGLDPRGAVRGTLGGFVLGAVMISAGIGILAAFGFYRVGSVVFAPGALAWAVVFFLSVSVLEEVIARGMVLRWLEPRTGSWLALGLSSLAFGVLHAANPNATLLATLAIALEAGVLLGAAYLATRGLWWPIGIHWSWNLFQGPVYGAHVSGMEMEGIVRGELVGPQLWTGGSFGPEAGLVMIVIGTAGGLGFVDLAVRRGRMRSARHAGTGQE